MPRAGICAKGRSKSVVGYAMLCWKLTGNRHHGYYFSIEMLGNQILVTVACVNRLAKNH